MPGYIIIHEESVTLESAEPNRQEIIETLEACAYDQLSTQGVDITNAKTTRLGEEHVEIVADGVKYRVVIVDRGIDPEFNLAVWFLQLRQY